jgi:signal transduction histidine kinase
VKSQSGQELPSGFPRLPVTEITPISLKRLQELTRKPTPRAPISEKPLLWQNLALADYKSGPRNSMRENFLTALSHELRTPLSVALGYSELLHNQMFGPLNQDQGHAVTTILRNFKALCASIDDAMSILEIEAGSIAYERQIFDPLSLLEELKTSLAPPCKNALRLQWKLPPKLPLMQTDRNALSKILSHLINHAIHLSDHDTVLVTARPKARQRIEFKVAELLEENCEQKLAHELPDSHGPELRGPQQGDKHVFGLYIAAALTSMLGGTLQTRRGLERGPSLAVSFPARI